MKVQLRCPLGLQPSEVLTGPGVNASKMAHSHDCGLEASVPHHMEAKCQTWQLMSSRGSDQDRPRRKL